MTSSWVFYLIDNASPSTSTWISGVLTVECHGVVTSHTYHDNPHLLYDGSRQCTPKECLLLYVLLYVNTLMVTYYPELKNLSSDILRLLLE